MVTESLHLFLSRGRVEVTLSLAFGSWGLNLEGSRSWPIEGGQKRPFGQKRKVTSSRLEGCVYRQLGGQVPLYVKARMRLQIPAGLKAHGRC